VSSPFGVLAEVAIVNHVIPCKEGVDVIAAQTEPLAVGIREAEGGEVVEAGDTVLLREGGVVENAKILYPRVRF